LIVAFIFDTWTRRVSERPILINGPTTWSPPSTSTSTTSTRGN